MPTPEGLEGKSLNELEDSLATLQQQLNALQAEISKRKGVDSWASVSNPASSVDKMEYSGRLYICLNERITQQDVLSVVNSIKEPYSSEISNYMKSNDIGWLQHYLNGKIDSWEIDSSKLRQALASKRIWLNGNHILEDRKFWPQTLETIKFLVKESWEQQQEQQTQQQEQQNQQQQEQQTQQQEQKKQQEDEVYIVDEDKTEKFKTDRFNSLRRKAQSLLPNKVSMVRAESPNPENPEFTIKIDDKYNWSVVKYVKFNFHDYLNGDTFYEEKFKTDVRKAKEEWYEERTFQNWIEKNNKYSLEELFPWESSSVSLSEFFEQFRNNKLKIGSASFDIDGDKLYLHFDKRYFDAARWCDQQIDKKDLKWEDGKYSEEKFKEKLRDVVRQIASEL